MVLNINVFFRLVGIPERTIIAAKVERQLSVVSYQLSAVSFQPSPVGPESLPRGFFAFALLYDGVFRLDIESLQWHALVMKMTIPAAALREVSGSEVISLHIEEAIDCHGEYCLGSTRPVLSDTGEPEPLPPHYHLVLSGQEPESGPRYYAVGEGLPSL